MAKLALYFIASSNPQPRTLDTDGHELNYVWALGRGTGCDIVFHLPTVSKNHARIRFDEESALWQVMDSNSRNGTWFNGKRLPPGQWTNILEGDACDFGDSEARIRFSYDTDSTLSGWEEIEDDTPTGELSTHEGVPVAPAIPPSIQPASNPWGLADKGLVWLGQRISGLPPWMQFITLMVLGLATAATLVLIFSAKATTR